MQTGEETRQVGKMEIKKKKREISCAGAGYIGYILPFAGKTGITGVPLAGITELGHLIKATWIKLFHTKLSEFLGF